MIINCREPRGLFYLKDGSLYVGIDNSSGDAWVEEFKRKSECKKWLKGEIEADEIGNRGLLQFFKNASLKR